MAVEMVAEMRVEMTSSSVSQSHVLKSKATKSKRHRNNSSTPFYPSHSLSLSLSALLSLSCWWFHVKSDAWRGCFWQSFCKHVEAIKTIMRFALFFSFYIECVTRFFLPFLHFFFILDFFCMLYFVLLLTKVCLLTHSWNSIQFRFVFAFIFRLFCFWKMAVASLLLYFWSVWLSMVCCVCNECVCVCVGCLSQRFMRCNLHTHSNTHTQKAK